jgi:hypothetical protein
MSHSVKPSRHFTLFDRRMTVVCGILRFCSGISKRFMSGYHTRVWIPSSVEVIYECSFNEYISLSSVTFDDDSKLTRLEHRAFWSSGLTSIHIPSSVELICERCFSRCSSLSSVTFDDDSKLTRLERWAFASSALTSIHIPSSVEVICEWCFSQCDSLSSVTFNVDSKLRPTLSGLLTGDKITNRFFCFCA